MKKIFIILFLGLTFSKASAQSMTIDQTLEYINKKWKLFGEYETYHKFQLKDDFLYYNNSPIASWKDVEIEDKFYFGMSKEVYVVAFYYKDVLKKKYTPIYDLGGGNTVSSEEIAFEKWTFKFEDENLGVVKAFQSLQKLVIKQYPKANDPFKK